MDLLPRTLGTIKLTCPIIATDTEYTAILASIDKARFMRYATVVLDPSDDYHTFDDLRHVRMDDDVVATYEAIYDLNPLDDGTVVELVQLTGDVERLARTVPDHSGVTFMVTSRRTGLLYVHFEPGLGGLPLLVVGMPALSPLRPHLNQ